MRIRNFNRLHIKVFRLHSYPQCNFLGGGTAGERKNSEGKYE
ncbi:MAG: hypothetical protein ACFFAK_10795 [Promethearchaeota archaeon]